MKFFKEIIGSFKELKKNVSLTKKKVAILEGELKQAQKVEEDIQRKVEEFQFSIQGNLDKINKISENLLKTKKVTHEKN
ncbi:MAG: hypothetical protein ACK5LM_04290 [Lactovum sp.]